MVALRAVALQDVYKRQVLEREGDTNVIAQILERKNMFVRPPVANVDQLFIVASTVQPVPSTLVIDKLSAIAVDLSLIHISQGGGAAFVPLLRQGGRTRAAGLPALRRAHPVHGLRPVSYTHLDVYKRQGQ